MRFNFGGNSPLSYEDIQRQRAVADRLRAANAQTPQNLGEGLAAIGRALGARRRERRADEAETLGRSQFGEQMAGMFSPTQTSSTYTPANVGGDVASDSVAEIIRLGLVERGLPEHVAQGFVMNMRDESGLDPRINEVSPMVEGSRGGFGLAQWTGPRRVALEQFAANSGRDVGDINTQLDFLMSELQGPEARAFEGMMGTQDQNAAAVSIARDFLRPSQENLDKRVAQYGGGQAAQPNTQQILDLMANPYATQAQQAYLTEMLQRSLPKTREQELQERLMETQIASAGTPKDTRTADQKNYEYYKGQESSAGRQPLSFNEWKVQEAQIEAGSQQNAEVAKLTLKRADETSSAGVQAGRNAGRLQVLEGLLEDAPQGFTGALTQMAGNFGVNVEGLDKVQAAAAIINAMVPEQRPAGSGPMSDADLELFKQSLPRIINTPDGNKLILDVLRANVEWDMAAGRIADQYLTQEITATEYRKQLREMESPIANLADRVNSISVPSGVDIPADGVSAMSDDDLFAYVGGLSGTAKQEFLSTLSDEDFGRFYEMYTSNK